MAQTRSNSLFVHIVLGIAALLPPTLAARVTSPSKVPKNAVLLSKVSSLTLRAGKATASRRVSPVPQLQCVGPAEICKLYAVDAMRCTNEGADYEQENIQWSCKASLPEEFKLGGTDVSCEGYASSEDPYVLKGSCGVEYRLMLTDKGEEKFGVTNELGGFGMGKGANGAEKYAGWLFMAIFLAVLFVIVRGFFRAWNNDPARRGGRGNGGGGGGGGGGNDDPPPPYDHAPDYGSPSKKPTVNANIRFDNTSRASSSQPRNGQQQGWRPGFWTGTVGGAVAGYLAGNRGQTRTRPENTQRTGGGLFGRGSGPRQPPAPSSGSGGPSFSSSRHESTGFGGTSRR